MPANFQDFQRQFAAHLRAPRVQPRPPGASVRGAAIYRELVFNNVCGFLDSCFPVCRATLGEGHWRRLNRAFLREWPLHTPLFREIPEAFVAYLAARGELLRPRWLADLARYEYLELMVDVLETPDVAVDPAASLVDDYPQLNPAMRLFSSAWPVHCIGPEWRPRKPRETWLVVHRTADDVVHFTEINRMTARLLALLAEPGRTGRGAVDQLAREASLDDSTTLQRHAAQLLQELCAQQIILGAVR